MNWLAIIPWAALVAIAVRAVTFIIWLVRLDGRSSRTSEDFKEYKEVRADARKDYRKEIDDRFDLVGSRIGLVEDDVGELQITVITKEDLTELKSDQVDRGRGQQDVPRDRQAGSQALQRYRQDQGSLLSRRQHEDEQEGPGLGHQGPRQANG